MRCNNPNMAAAHQSFELFSPKSHEWHSRYEEERPFLLARDLVFPLQLLCADESTLQGRDEMGGCFLPSDHLVWPEEASTCHSDRDLCGSMPGSAVWTCPFAQLSHLRPALHSALVPPPPRHPQPSWWSRGQCPQAFALELFRGVLTYIFLNGTVTNFCSGSFVGGKILQN